MTSTTQHTPTWYARFKEAANRKVGTIGIDAADAREACNAHDELVAALREIATARAGDDKFPAYDAADRYRNIARAALAKVQA